MSYNCIICGEKISHPIRRQSSHKCNNNILENRITGGFYYD